MNNFWMLPICLAISNMKPTEIHSIKELIIAIIISVVIIIIGIIIFWIGTKIIDYLFEKGIL